MLDQVAITAGGVLKQLLSVQRSLGGQRRRERCVAARRVRSDPDVLRLVDRNRSQLVGRIRRTRRRGEGWLAFPALSLERAMTVAEPESRFGRSQISRCRRNRFKQTVAQFAHVIYDTRRTRVVKPVGGMIAPRYSHSADTRTARHFNVECRIANHDCISGRNVGFA
jgi:hypothetical protein